MLHITTTLFIFIYLFIFYELCMNSIMNEKSSQSSWQNIQLQMSLQKCYMCIHVYKRLTLRHDYSHDRYHIG
jgi:hypothetical protein